MPDREKVMWGLKACNRKRNNGSDCENCPYYDDEDTAELPFGICNIQDMFDDALALLKAQEAVEPKIVQSKDFLWSHWYICGACEYPVDPGDKYCRKCGRPIKWEEDSNAD